MNKLGMWQVIDGKLKRVNESALDLEKSLEEWITEDPSLVQAGLVIVGRQIELEGGRLDLLAIDPQGRWTIIEIKKGVLRRETIAQAIDYASCIATLTAETLRSKIEPFLKKYNQSLDAILAQRDAQDSLDPSQREVALIIVGTGRGSGLERISQFLADRYNMPLTVITFEVFAFEDQKVVLAREITELETTQPVSESVAKASIQQVLDLADRAGTGQVIRRFIDVCNEIGIYPRPWKTSIMFAPPKNRNRTLFTVWVQPQEDLIRMWVGNKVFNEFYPVSEDSVSSHIGPEGWRTISEKQTEEFLVGLKSLFQMIASAESFNG